MVRNVLLQSILEIGKQEIIDEISRNTLQFCVMKQLMFLTKAKWWLYLGTKKVVSRWKGFWAFFSPLV